MSDGCLFYILHTLGVIITEENTIGVETCNQINIKRKPTMTYKNCVFATQIFPIGFDENRIKTSPFSESKFNSVHS